MEPGRQNDNQRGQEETNAVAPPGHPLMKPAMNECWRAHARGNERKAQTNNLRCYPQSVYLADPLLEFGVDFLVLKPVWSVRPAHQDCLHAAGQECERNAPCHQAGEKAADPSGDERDQVATGHDECGTDANCRAKQSAHQSTQGLNRVEQEIRDDEVQVRQLDHGVRDPRRSAKVGTPNSALHVRPAVEILEDVADARDDTRHDSHDNAQDDVPLLLRRPPDLPRHHLDRPHGGDEEAAQADAAQGRPERDLQAGAHDRLLGVPAEVPPAEHPAVGDVADVVDHLVPPNTDEAAEAVQYVRHVRVLVAELLLELHVRRDKRHETGEAPHDSKNGADDCHKYHPRMIFPHARHALGEDDHERDVPSPAAHYARCETHPEEEKYGTDGNRLGREENQGDAR
mmetsp:Transcript_60550/g.157140  ORF Transcript_60550/g.157140 Transcript_60550/m.157140 type:complete len:400 (-) Transcript_60550:111-1310(-)